MHLLGDAGEERVLEEEVEIEALIAPQ
jgi:hypothetical protein